MSIGMTYDQYWYGDVWMVKAFREADRLRQKRENESAWLMGAYFRMAIDSTICNAFREKGSTPVRYPDKPFGSDEPEKKKREKKQQQEDREATFAMAYMMNFVRAGQNWGN